VICTLKSLSHSEEQTKTQLDLRLEHIHSILKIPAHAQSLTDALLNPSKLIVAKRAMTAFLHIHTLAESLTHDAYFTRDRFMCWRAYSDWMHQEAAELNELLLRIDKEIYTHDKRERLRKKGKNKKEKYKEIENHNNDKQQDKHPLEMKSFHLSSNTNNNNNSNNSNDNKNDGMDNIKKTEYFFTELPNPQELTHRHPCTRFLLHMKRQNQNVKKIYKTRGTLNKKMWTNFGKQKQNGTSNYMNNNQKNNQSNKNRVWIYEHKFGMTNVYYKVYEMLVWKIFDKMNAKKQTERKGKKTEYTKFLIEDDQVCVDLCVSLCVRACAYV